MRCNQFLFLMIVWLFIQEWLKLYSWIPHNLFLTCLFLIRHVIIKKKISDSGTNQTLPQRKCPSSRYRVTYLEWREQVFQNFGSLISRKLDLKRTKHKANFRFKFQNSRNRVLFLFLLCCQEGRYKW